MGIGLIWLSMGSRGGMKLRFLPEEKNFLTNCEIIQYSGKTSLLTQNIQVSYRSMKDKECFLGYFNENRK